MLVWISPILRYLTSLLPSSIRAVGLRSNGSPQISVCKHMTVSISKKVLYIKTLDKTSNFSSITFRRTQLVRRPANLPARMAYWKVTAERKRSLRCQERWQFCRYKINFARIKKFKKTFLVPERYWLNSNGAFIYVDERVPLFVDQNMLQDGRVCFIAKTEGPYINRTRVREIIFFIRKTNI